MAQKKKQFFEEVALDRLYPNPTLKIGSGFWSDIDGYFVRKDPNLPDEVYFDDLPWAYETQQEFEHFKVYDQA